MIMNEWWKQYLGKPWEAVPNPPHSYTCGELLRAVHLEMFGIETAPILADALDLRDCIMAMKGERYGLRPLDTDEKPREFDSVFMARVKYVDHVGIGVQTTDGLLVLHCLRGAGVVLESPGELRGRGFRRLDWFRHQELPYA